jgi:hypothetical protein
LRRSYSAAADDDGQRGSSWVPSWMKSKLPAALGGTKPIEDLTMDTFASSLKQARRLGGISGFVHGTSAGNDPTAQGTMRLFEGIIAQMEAGEKEDLGTFGPAQRQRVAAAAGCTLAQVDDCIARYSWMRATTARMAQLQREGKAMPKSVGEVESMLGTWRDYKTTGPSGDGGGGDGPGAVPRSQRSAKGQPCPLAGQQVGKSTKCPLTRKAFKACCGKALGAAG